MPKGRPKKKQIPSTVKVENIDTTQEVKIRVKCVGRIYDSVGSTFDEALDKIKIPNGARALSYITVTKGGVEKTKILNPAHTQNLFSNVGPTARGIALKWVRQLFQ